MSAKQKSRGNWDAQDIADAQGLDSRKVMVNVAERGGCWDGRAVEAGRRRSATMSRPTLPPSPTPWPLLVAAGAVGGALWLLILYGLSILWLS